MSSTFSCSRMVWRGITYHILSAGSAVMKFSSKFPTITSIVTRPDENQLVKITYGLLFLLIITVLFKRFKLSIWTSELKVIWSGSRNYSLHNLISRVWLHVCGAKKNPTRSRLLNIHCLIDVSRPCCWMICILGICGYRYSSCLFSEGSLKQLYYFFYRIRCTSL